MSDTKPNPQPDSKSADSAGKTDGSENTEVEVTKNPVGEGNMLNRIIKRLGGRHLIFRTEMGKLRWLPRPYALVSTFRGPVWLFYGVGQIWLTHRKYQSFDGWLSRVPRLPAPRTIELLDSLKDPLTEFTHYCNENGIEGTIVLEPKVLEFHWTFGYDLKRESQKTENTNLLDQPFQQLVDHYIECKKQLGFAE